MSEMSGIYRATYLLLVLIASWLELGLENSLSQECEPIADQNVASEPLRAMRAAMLGESEMTQPRLEALKSEGFNTLVFQLHEVGVSDVKRLRYHLSLARHYGFEIGFWVEVARCKPIADLHPEWMASLQTHDEWRRYYPKSPSTKPNEVTKTYPWVPILSKETFEAQSKRVLDLLDQLPRAEYIFLNDLQGAPSACGCGNDLCRWTSDYGDRRTTIPIGEEAAAKFVLRIQDAFKLSEVIPIWTTECEERDGHPSGQCAGVGCFNGICWKSYNRQLTPLSLNCGRIGVLTLQNTFQRALPANSSMNSWLEYAISTFQTVPEKYGGEAIPPRRLITVIEGWGTSKERIDEQLKANAEVGTNGYIIAYEEIDQSWLPKVVKWK